MFKQLQKDFVSNLLRLGSVADGFDELLENVSAMLEETPDWLPEAEAAPLLREAKAALVKVCEAINAVVAATEDFPELGDFGTSP